MKVYLLFKSEVYNCDTYYQTFGTKDAAERALEAQKKRNPGDYVILEEEVF